MKCWTRFVACFLIAWLPLLGYTAQAGACPEMTSSGMSRPAGVSSMTGMAPDAQKASTHASGASSICHGSGSLLCGMAVLPASHAALDIPSLHVYQATVPFLSAQFIPEPLQPPPRSL
ncbi:UNVERIFIED_ORG: hypothetical protein BDU10_9187 [Burkholderia sp. CF145]|jgi:hypothetical protein